MLELELRHRLIANIVSIEHYILLLSVEILATVDGTLARSRVSSNGNRSMHLVAADGCKTLSFAVFSGTGTLSLVDISGTGILSLVAVD